MGASAPPFPSAETIITAARMYVNDVAPGAGGNLLADAATYTLANFNAAYRFARRRLANAGVEAVTDYVNLLNLLPVANQDPATVVYVDWTGYWDGANQWASPALPPDMLLPLWVRQRMSGQYSSRFVPLGASNDGLPAITQTAYFQSWEWRNNRLQFSGALQSNDVRVLYQKFFADIADFTATIPLPDCQDALAYLIAEHYLRSRGGAGSADMERKADQALSELIRPTIRQKQRGQHRRRPWGASRSGYWPNGNYGSGDGGGNGGF